MAESLSLEEEKMKNYTITVNGNVYEVTVEEGAAEQHRSPAAVPGQTEGSPQSGTQGSCSSGGVAIKASLPGKVVKVEASVGQAVKAGDNVVILEAMKMEVPGWLQPRTVPSQASM